MKKEPHTPETTNSQESRLTTPETNIQSTEKMSSSAIVPMTVPKDGSAKNLNMPKLFNGRRQDYKKFMQDVVPSI
jgi:hypothetical protein